MEFAKNTVVNYKQFYKTYTRSLFLQQIELTAFSFNKLQISRSLDVQASSEASNLQSEGSNKAKSATKNDQ